MNEFGQIWCAIVYEEVSGNWSAHAAHESDLAIEFYLLVASGNVSCRTPDFSEEKLESRFM